MAELTPVGQRQAIVPAHNGLASPRLLAVARQALAEADTLPDITRLVDQAEVVRIAARRAHLGLASQNDWAAFKLDAERKAGALLAQMAANGELAKGAAEPQRPDTMSGRAQTLVELGVADDTVKAWQRSHRWQLEAALPEADYEAYKAKMRDEDQEITSAGVLRLAKQQILAREVEARAHNAAVIPTTPARYRCLVLDPPWPVQKILREARPNQDAFDYPTMSLEEIQALDVPGLADPDGCHVYLWVTHKCLPFGFELFAAWGVAYECLLTWVKPSGMTPFSWMYNSEHVLFGRLGSLEVERKGLKLAFDAPVIGHSIKPDAFYERVVQASPGPRLELFARRHREGFSVWGNEVPEDAA